MSQKYTFDKTRMEFKRVTHNVWTVLGTILKYFLVTASLAVVYYAVFALFVSTDSERRLKRENQMYSRMYEEMTGKEELIGDVVQGLKARDNEIYRELFNSDAPDLANAGSDDFLPSVDSVGDIVNYMGRKLDVLEAVSCRVEENFREVMEKLQRGDAVVPPMTNPLHGFSYARTGASIGKKINPFYKVPAFHGGLDLISPQGEPVHASADGTVSNVIHSTKGLGNVVEITHAGGYVTRYAHLENTRVAKGQKVTLGKQIGQVGLSGNSFAPHLHYEVLRDTVRLDPLSCLFASVTPEEYAGMLFMSSNTGQSMD